MFAGYEVLGEDDCSDHDAIYVFVGEVVLPASLAGERHWPRPVLLPDIDLSEGVTHVNVDQMLAHMVDRGDTGDSRASAIIDAEADCYDLYIEAWKMVHGERRHGRW